jgi:hypothetical protein
VKEQKEIIIRAPQTQAITQIIANHNVPLQPLKNAMGSRKTEDQKVEAQKKMIVKKQTRILFLQNNELRSIKGMYMILQDVMWNHTNLIWIDLSYNYLESLEDEILNF